LKDQELSPVLLVKQEAIIFPTFVIVMLLNYGEDANLLINLLRLLKEKTIYLNIIRKCKYYEGTGRQAKTKDK
jgi:hypothetical protein